MTAAASPSASVAAGRSAAPAGAPSAAAPSAADPLQRRPRHHPRLVGPLRRRSTCPSRHWSRAATPGRPRPARPSPWARADHLHPRDRRLSPTSRAMPPACATWPDSAQPKLPRRPGSGSSSRRTTPRLRRWCRVFAPHDIAKELALKAPLSLGHATHPRRQRVDAIEGTQTFGGTSQHVVLYVRPAGTHVPVEEDSVNAKGKPQRRPSTSSTPSGASGASPGTPGRGSIGPVGSISAV